MVTVQKIHKSFFGASDKLLKEAEAIIIEDKTADRMRKLGFKHAKRIKLNDGLIEKKRIADVIMEYKVKYPLCKFITRKEVDILCKKYSLVLAAIDLYKGDIPEKNIVQMEQFSIQDEDRYVNMWENGMFTFSSGILDIYSNRLLGTAASEVKPKEQEPVKMDFKICAPQKDIEMTGMKKVKNQIVPEDPIVLHPIKDGYLIVTAWGDEASDEIVVNEINN